MAREIQGGGQRAERQSTVDGFGAGETPALPSLLPSNFEFDYNRGLCMGERT